MLYTINNSVFIKSWFTIDRQAVDFQVDEDLLYNKWHHQCLWKKMNYIIVVGDLTTGASLNKSYPELLGIKEVSK